MIEVETSSDLDRGIASEEKRIASERQSLSVRCGGKAALLSFLLAIFSFTAVAQEPTPSPSPSPQELQVPAVASDFHPRQKPLPELSRVGVDMDRQRPLSMREALALALANNKDIEVARQNVRISEFDLKSAQGVYDPRLSSTSYYERVESPISSFLSGGSNGAVT
ncbi:MAG TPA: TolC family protein, partial [Pyrinomonadaceae bacterium]